MLLDIRDLCTSLHLSLVLSIVVIVVYGCLMIENNAINSFIYVLIVFQVMNPDLWGEGSVSPSPSWTEERNQLRKRTFEVNL